MSGSRLVRLVPALALLALLVLAVRQQQNADHAAKTGAKEALQERDGGLFSTAGERFLHSGIRDLELKSARQHRAIERRIGALSTGVMRLQRARARARTTSSSSSTAPPLSLAPLPSSEKVASSGVSTQKQDPMGPNGAVSVEPQAKDQTGAASEAQPETEGQIQTTQGASGDGDSGESATAVAAADGPLYHVAWYRECGCTGWALGSYYYNLVVH